MRHCVWSRNLVNEEPLSHWGLSRLMKKKKWFACYNLDLNLELQTKNWTYEVFFFYVEDVLGRFITWFQMQDVVSTQPLHVLMLDSYWTSASSRRGPTRNADVDIHNIMNWLNSINLLSILALTRYDWQTGPCERHKNFAGESLCVLKKYCISCMKRDYCRHH